MHDLFCERTPHSGKINSKSDGIPILNGRCDVVKRNQWRCEIQAQKNAERKGNPKSPPDSAVPTPHSKLSIWVCPLHYDLTEHPVSIEDQLLSGALFLWRKVHFTLFFNLPSASQSSTSSSTINTPLSPRQRLHARQPVRRSPQCSIWMSAEPQRSQFSDTTVSHLLEQLSLIESQSIFNEIKLRPA